MPAPSIHELRNNSITPSHQVGKNSNRVEEKRDMFGEILGAALNNVNTTNKYLSDAENEEIKLAMGQATSTHDLAIALQKASTALQYTVTVKNAFMEAYRSLINMQI